MQTLAILRSLYSVFVAIAFASPFAIAGDDPSACPPLPEYALIKAARVSVRTQDRYLDVQVEMPNLNSWYGVKCHIDRGFFRFLDSWPKYTFDPSKLARSRFFEWKDGKRVELATQSYFTAEVYTFDDSISIEFDWISNDKNPAYLYSVTEITLTKDKPPVIHFRYPAGKDEQWSDDGDEGQEYLRTVSKRRKAHNWILY
jgi:hypothetical protein